MLQGPEAENISVSVLMHGPTGCGKSTAVSATAAALGLNVIPYSCHEFVGQSDAAMAMAIRTAFENAQEFAPAILFLKNLSALCSAEQAQGSASGDLDIVMSPTDCWSHLTQKVIVRTSIFQDSYELTFCIHMKVVALQVVEVLYGWLLLCQSALLRAACWHLSTAVNTATGPRLTRQGIRRPTECLWWPARRLSRISQFLFDAALHMNCP